MIGMKETGGKYILSNVSRLNKKRKKEGKQEGKKREKWGEEKGTKAMLMRQKGENG